MLTSVRAFIQRMPTALQLLQTIVQGMIPAVYEVRKVLNTELTAGNGIRLRVLVVDDQEEMRSALSRALSLEGFEVTLVATGSRALELLNTAVFNLVLLDVHMPDMDGFSVLAKMREKPELQTLPVIMVTGADDALSVLQGKQLGVNEYLVKPYRVAELLLRIERCLRSV